MLRWWDQQVKKVIITLSLVWLIGLTGQVKVGYRAGQTIRASIVYGSFWPVRYVCDDILSLAGKCDVWPYQLLPNDWVAQWRPEAKVELDKRFEASQKEPDEIAIE